MISEPINFQILKNSPKSQSSKRTRLLHITVFPFIKVFVLVSRSKSMLWLKSRIFYIKVLKRRDGIKRKETR